MEQELYQLWLREWWYTGKNIVRSQLQNHGTSDTKWNTRHDLEGDISLRISLWLYRGL